MGTEPVASEIQNEGPPGLRTRPPGRLQGVPSPRLQPSEVHVPERACGQPRVLPCLAVDPGPTDLVFPYVKQTISFPPSGVREELIKELPGGLGPTREPTPPSRGRATPG